jgi:hypothetical protein
VKGIAEQLGPTSKMAWENKMTLDMILPEKGRVCILIGGKCCTFIPNDSSVNGTRTKALQGLTALSNELAKNSGINDPLSYWLDQQFGKWQRVMTSILMLLIIAFGTMALMGYCIIPCTWGLILRLIETTLTKQIPHIIPIVVEYS